ncbi:MAG: prolipoprotein diacylglyceryl transferase family protein [Bacteroidota bacterium]
MYPDIQYIAQAIFGTPMPDWFGIIKTFGLFVLLLWGMRKRVKYPLHLFGFYLILNGIERFFIEKIRVNYKKLANIPLACLKLTIVMVCSFIDVPYQYLFYTSSFISLLMITAVIGSVREA